MRINVKVKMVTLIAVLMSVALLTWGMRGRLFHKYVLPEKTPVKKNTISRTIMYDSVLIKKFKIVAQSFNPNNTVFTYSGTLNMVDGADTTVKVKNVSFLFCRQNNNTYTKTGDAETINAHGIYLYIEHDHKRIIVSSQKSIDQKQPLPDMSKLVENLRAERYEMKNKIDGKNETISIVNEHHITCKEYAITFDTVSRKVTHFRIRLTNFNEPLNKSKEKVIDVSMGTFNESANIEQYMNTDKIVIKAGNDWKLRAPYSDYELIKLP